MKYSHTLFVFLFSVMAAGLYAQETPCTAQDMPLSNIDPMTCSNQGSATVTLASPATASGVPDPGDCGSGVFPADAKDVWIKFTLPANSYSATVEAKFGFSSPDLAYAVYSGTDCNNLSYVQGSCGVSDNSPYQNAENIVITGQTPGQTLYVRIWEVANKPTNGIKVFVESAPINDECVQASPLSGTGCNYGATDTEPEANGWTPDYGQVGQPGWMPTCQLGPDVAVNYWNSNENAVWYTFTVTPSTPQPITIEILDVVCTTSNKLMQMGVWSDNNTCDLSQETSYGCAIGTGTVSLSIGQTIPVGNYYLLVDGSAGSKCEWRFESEQIFCSIFAGADKDFCAGDDISTTLGGNPSTNDPNPVITWTSNPANAVNFLSSTSAANPVLTIPNAQAATYTFYVTLDGSDPGCLVSDTIVVRVNANPSVTITPTGGGCSTDPVTLTANGTGGTPPYTYTWDNGLGAGNPKTVNPAVPTTYHVTLTDAKNCTATASIAVSPNSTPPNSNLNLTATSNSICSGSGVTISLTNSETGVNYQLQPGGAVVPGNGGTIVLLNTTLTSTTTFDLVASNASNAACSVTLEDAITITVNPQPSVTVTRTNEGNNCDGPTTITATASGGSGNYTYTWDNGLGAGSQHTVSPTVETTYNVTVTDSNGGCTAIGSITVAAQGTTPSDNFTADADKNPICRGESTAIIIHNSQVGVTYAFQGPQGVAVGAMVQGTGGDILIPTEALYQTTTFSIVAYNTANPNCEIVVADLVTVVVNTAPTSANAGPDQTICNGNSATMNATAPTIGTGLWTQVSGPNTATITSPSSPNTTVTGLTNGSYVFEWQVSSEGCDTETEMVSDQVTINISNLSASATTVATTTVGGNDGQIILCITGGAAPYNVNYTPTQGSINTTIGSCDGNFAITGLAEGCYGISIVDANGCSATLTNQCITGPPCSDFSITSVVSSNETCNEANDGQITINILNGQGNITYSIGNGVPSVTTSETSYTFSGLSAGTYNVIVTDERGCSISYLLNPVIITQPAPLAVSYTATTPSTLGGNDGSVNICVNGGTAPYSVTSTPAAAQSTTQAGCAANFTIAGLQAGVYNITVTDANGCTFNIQAVVQPISCNINIASTSGVQPSCNGASNGTATVTVGGNGTSYQYAIDGGPFSVATANTSFTFTGLAAGTHTITVVNNLNCQVSTTVTIAQPEGITTSETVTPPTTVGGSNGAISLCVNGGTPPYSANMSPMPAGANIGTGAPTASCDGVFNITNLPSGSYAIVVTDNNGCTHSINVTVPAVACTDFDISSTTSNNVTCFQANNGQINVTVSGGTPPYQYAINNGAFEPALGTSSQAYTFTSLAAGTYIIIVRDASLCQARDTVILTQPTSLPTASITSTNPTTIGGSNGQICITPTGGTPPYNITASCGTVVAGAGSSCGGEYHIDNLAAGSCFIQLSDANGCTAQATVTLTDPACSDFGLASVTPSNYSCADEGDGSITITISGGQAPYTYTIGSMTFTTNETTYTFGPLSAGTYNNISVTDSRGCKVSLAGVVQINNVAALSTSATTTSACGTGTGSIDLSVTGGTPVYTYVWSNGATTQDITGLQAGTYTVTVTDSKNCRKTAQVTVPGSNLGITAAATAACGGGNTGALDITVTGGSGNYGYAWSNGLPSSQDQTGLAAGSYSVTVTDNATGCQQTATLAVPTSNMEIQAGTTPACNAQSVGAITLFVTNGQEPYTYDWADLAGTDNPKDRDNLPVGSYSVTVTDAQGCKQSATIAISESTIAINPSTTAACQGNDGTITIAPTGGQQPYDIAWQNGLAQGATTQTGLAVGSYSVTVTGLDGCSTTATIAVTGSNLAVNGNITAACGGGNTGTIDISATGGSGNYDYIWSNGSTSQDVNNLAPGSYTVTVTDRETGCKVEASFIVPNVTIGVDIQTRNTCAGMEEGTITLTPTGGSGDYSYTWAPNVGNSSSVDGLANGSYNFTITDNASGCSITDGITIGTFASPSVTATSDALNNTIINGQSTVLTGTPNGGTPDYTYSWTPGGANTASTTVSPTETTTYTVKVTDANGCMATDVITITVNDLEFIKMPTAFAPGGNVSENQTYGPVTNLPADRIRTFKIFNRWGQVIFDDPNSKWDGTFKSTDQPVGVYVYLLEYLDSTGEKQLEKGHFTLVR
jgi:gliding motility-associated-like protein